LKILERPSIFCPSDEGAGDDAFLDGVGCFFGTGGFLSLLPKNAARAVVVVERCPVVSAGGAKAAVELGLIATARSSRYTARKKRLVLNIL